MAKTRALRRRIRSIESTRQVTRTMEMVSTSKLKRAQDRVVGARPYAQALAETIGDLLSPELAERFPLLRQPAPPDKGGPNRAAVLLITSNRGLAGAFNANLIRAARERVHELEARGTRSTSWPWARRASATSSSSGARWHWRGSTSATARRAAQAAELVAPLIAQFEAGELASLDVVSAHYKSALSTPPVVERVLPVAPRRAGAPAGGGRADAHSGGKRSDAEAGAAHAAPVSNFILRPGPDEIVAALLPLYVRNLVFRALVETAASEHGARRVAMKSATDNAGEILDVLRRTYNRARQGQITQELAEIVGGAEALKG